MPKISVLIPTFNCAHLICDAIESVLKQTFTDYEIIVIDDGSNDNTRERLAKYILDKRIIYLYQKNKGVADARNVGINYAKGEYIACFDADDLFSPEALSELFKSAQENRSGWVISDIVRIEGTQRIVQKAELPGDEKLMDMLRKKYNFQSHFYRKDILENIGCYDSQQKYYEDWDLYIRLIEKNIPFSYAPQVLYIYKIRPQSITKQKAIKLNLFYIERIYRKHYLRLAKTGNSEAGKLYVQFMWELASDYFHKTKNIGATLSTLYQCIKYNPLILIKYVYKFIKNRIKNRTANT